MHIAGHRAVGTRRSHAHHARTEPIDERAHARCGVKHDPLTGIRRYCTRQHGQKQCIKARGARSQVPALSIQLGPLPHKEWHVCHEYLLMASVSRSTASRYSAARQVELSDADVVADEADFQSNVPTGMFSDGD